METTAITLPDEGQFRADIQAINKFQQVVHATMISGHDYGVIPGTQKPTLLKPGAEKIVKLLGLADQYELTDRQEDWNIGFFRYIIKCQLVSISSQVVVSEGLGECNSMESKYRWRWVFQSYLPDHLKSEAGKVERDKLISREIKTSQGKAKQYRLDNEDIYSQVNTILKMAKKRALVDAALSAGRLSDLFTQDIEDIRVNEPVVESKPVTTTTAPQTDEKPPVEEKPTPTKKAEPKTTPETDIIPPEGTPGAKAWPGMSFQDLLEYVKANKQTAGWLFQTTSMSIDEANKDPYKCAMDIKAIAGW